MQLSGTAFEQVRGLASDIFGVPSGKLSANSSPETVESWDSVQHLNLVLAVEERFGIQLDPEEIERMKTIGEIAAMVDKKLHSAAR